MAQHIPICGDIALIAPAQGKNFTGTRPIFFNWSGEPVGTASRELHLAALDGSETVIPLEGRFSDTVTVKVSGDLAWAVYFRDANGNLLCATYPGLLVKGTRGGSSLAANAASLSSSGPGAPPPPSRLVAGFTNDGRLVIMMEGSPYTGQYARLVQGNNYDGTNEDLMGAVGLEIHGNNNNNVIVGSNGSDEIRPYRGNDEIDGGPGDDTTYLQGGAKIIRDPASGDVDRYYVKGDVQLTGSMADGDALDQLYFELGTSGLVTVDFGDIGSLVPSVPE